MRRAVAVVGALATVLTACSATPTPDGTDVAGGWTVEVVRDDLVGPTQVALAPDGALLVAELAGGEDAGDGRVRDLGPGGAAPDPRVVVDGLLTPTGLQAHPDGGLVVQEQVDVVRIDPDAGRTVLVSDSPFNGRSQGTVGQLDEGNTEGVFIGIVTVTGTGSGPAPAEGSGVLSVVTDGLRNPIAVGFKNAYAHALGPDGALYVTEVGDGRYDGEAPPDELNVLPEAVWRAALHGDADPYDGGWPRCTGDADPTEEFGATTEECEALPRPLALFPPRATPTSVAVTSSGRVLVALWVEDRVVEVDPATGEVTDVATGLDRPQHLLAMDDGTVLLTVHGSGELVRLTPPA